LRAGLRHPDRGALPPPEADPVRYLALAESHPEWLVRRWLSRFGREEAEALLRWDNRSAPLVVRCNTLRTSPEDLARRLSAEGVTARRGRYAPEALYLEGAADPEGLAAFREGLCQVQDEAAMLVAHAVSPRPGQTVLDVAAAPGGKATHLATLLGADGCVVANDRHAGRAGLIAANAARLGLRSVQVSVRDACQPPGDWEGRFACVLVDAPCTGLGVLRRRPDARWRKTPADLAAMAALQGQLLAAAARCVAPGGVLVYSTCSLEPEEDEEVVRAFLARDPRFRPEPLEGYLPTGLWVDGADGPMPGLLYIYPQRNQVDGFFVARLRRAEDPTGGR
ncbi:MAG: 16S rRNA (cytosine(967)-C(5))-methyltransferase RsmB, partial [Clostridia bacterium]|nr:16S rRNA (cytosine(967)-C(5))-methyltransferase RsmB [Clostridia bacterium]